MDPSQLVAPQSPLGYPAPYLFLAFFKGLGFTLHLWFMHLWYAGLPLAVIAYRFGGEHARHWAGRLAKQMPVIIAVGVNFGILALLFLQVAYYRVFYPATILMAWPWFSIFIGLTLAYYGVYLYEVSLRHDALTPLKRAVGWVAAAVFLIEGFLFANAMSLMTNVPGWAPIWERTNVGGAVLGTGLNLADPTLAPRWLMMFGLAITTVAAYLVIDAALFAVREGLEYRRWAGNFALKLSTAGILVFAVFGSWYVFGTWRPEARALMLHGPLVILTAATALSPGLSWLLIFLQRRGVTPTLAKATLVAQTGVLGINTISRQLVQNAELGRFFSLSTERVHVQWSATILFLTLLVAGLVILAWIGRKVWEAERRAPAH